MIKGNLISNLKKFGLSENEAKAYVGLVFLREASAREVHTVAEIPRVKVYEVLDNLIEKRYAVILHGTPIHYKATDPEDLLQMLREDYEKTAAEISKSFEEMELKAYPEDDIESTDSIQYLRSEWTVRKKMNDILEEAQNLIIFTRSPAIMKEIEDDLIAANKRLNMLILTGDAEGYEKFKIPITVYPENVRNILQELEESHIANQSCSIISDAGKALIIMKDETKIEAHYLSQSIVDFLYKTIYYFVSNADSIQLPEHFNASEQPKQKKMKADEENTKKRKTTPVENKKCHRTVLKENFRDNLKSKFKKIE